LHSSVHTTLTCALYRTRW